MLPWELDEAGKRWDEYVNKAMQDSNIDENMAGWDYCKKSLDEHMGLIIQCAYNGRTYDFMERLSKIINLCVEAYEGGRQEKSFADILSKKSLSLVSLSLNREGRVMTELLFSIIGLMNEIYIGARFCEDQEDFWEDAK